MVILVALLIGTLEFLPNSKVLSFALLPNNETLRNIGANPLVSFCHHFPKIQYTG